MECSRALPVRSSHFLIPVRHPLSGQHRPPRPIMTTRRDFLTIGAAALATTAASRSGIAIAPQPVMLPAQSDPLANELALDAISAAKDAGASYADARVGRYRRQQISTRDRS